MSRASSGISTIEDAWKYAAEEEERPSGLTTDYPDNRCLPNVASILSLCNVSIRTGVTYETNQLVKYEDLLVAPRDLKFKIIGQTNQLGTTVDVLPSFITSMEINDGAITPSNIYNSATKEYTLTNFQNTRIHLEIEAEYATQSITYRKEDNEYTFKALNGSTIYLMNVDSPPCTQLKYTWKVASRDIDLNFFVIKKSGDTYTTLGMFGYDENASSHADYWPVRSNGTLAPGVDTIPSGDTYDLCLSLDVDDTGSGNWVEVLTIYPIGKTWAQLMQEYNFVYAAIDYRGEHGMSGMTATARSDADPSIQEEFQIEPPDGVTFDNINAWLICRFGVSTNGRVVEYRGDDNKSIVYSGNNNITVDADVSKVGTSLLLKKGSSWTPSS